MNLEKYGNVYYDYDLYDNNTYKVHSICDAFIIIGDVIKLTNLVSNLNEHKKRYFVIGNGSNIILPSRLNAIVIKLDFKDINYYNNRVIVGASYLLNKLALDTINHNLTGLEWASGIPGSVGASIIGNAGAYLDEISNYIEEIEVLENNKIKIIKKNDIFFEYRNSSLKKRNLIILKATFNLKKGNKNKSLELIRDRAIRRNNTQPLEYPSAGSVFRNPENNYAGKLIEDVNLKGLNINGAEVSTKHANFIINKGNASGEDIVKLIGIVHDKVLKEHNIDLKLEQEIVNL